MKIFFFFKNEKFFNVLACNMPKSDQEADANSRFSEDQRPRPPFEGRVECVVDYVHTVSFHK